MYGRMTPNQGYHENKENHLGLSYEKKSSWSGMIILKEWTLKDNPKLHLTIKQFKRENQKEHGKNERTILEKQWKIGDKIAMRLRGGMDPWPEK